MYQASDVMIKKVTTISADATVDDAIRTLLEHRIGGVPVVDSRGMLVGMICEFQLLETVFAPQIMREPVRTFMRKDVISVSEDALLADVASILTMHHLRRVPVLRDGQLIGLITCNDLLRYVSETGEQIDAYLHDVEKYATEPSQSPTAAVC